jgi:hypothetical protein
LTEKLYKRNAVLKIFNNRNKQHFKGEGDMNKTKAIFASIVLAAVVLSGSASASAQLLDGAWFKLNVSIKGYSISNAACGVASKANFKTIVYLMLEWDAASDNYDCTRYCESSPGVWSGLFIDGFVDPALCTEEYVFLDQAYLPIRTPDNTILAVYLTAVIKSKLDKFSGLASATFTALGAEVPLGAAPNVSHIYAGAKVRGKTIDSLKLPFDPL